MLGALALAFPGELKRNELARAVWPDSPWPQAQQSFRQRLASLRSVLPGVIGADRTSVWLESHVCQLRIELNDGPIAERCYQLARSAGSRQLALSDEVRRIATLWPEGEYIFRSMAGLKRPEWVAWAKSDRQGMDHRLAAAIMAAHHSASPDDLRELISVGVSLTSLPLEPELKVAAVCLLQQLAACAHANGEWHDSIALEREALRQAVSQSLGFLEERSRFRLIRKQLDVAWSESALRQLSELRTRSGISVELAPWIDMNLVFACCYAKQATLAREAALRAHRSRSAASDPGLVSWLHLNEALLFASCQQPAQAKSCLQQAYRVISGSPAVGDLFWHAYVGVHVAEAMGCPEQAVWLHGIAESARKGAGSHVTPINRSKLDVTLRRCQRSLLPKTWLAASQRAAATAEPEIHQHYLNWLGV